MASAFFDGPQGSGWNYIPSMLDLFLNPPDAVDKRYTLPLLICGSPLYDPQAAGWFRAKYKDRLPLNENGTPEVNVLRAGRFKVRTGSERETPYMIANHMIAAGATGKCTSVPGKIPDIRKYEAQDLVAATFLYEYAQQPDLDPHEAKSRAFRRWFGNEDGSGAPKPASSGDSKSIRALAQMDLFFNAGPPPHPEYTWEEATRRCEEADDKFHPCCGSSAPSG